VHIKLHFECRQVDKNLQTSLLITCWAQAIIFFFLKKFSIEPRNPKARLRIISVPSIFIRPLIIVIATHRLRISCSSDSEGKGRIVQIFRFYIQARSRRTHRKIRIVLDFNRNNSIINFTTGLISATIGDSITHGNRKEAGITTRTCIRVNLPRIANRERQRIDCPPVIKRDRRRRHITQVSL